MFKGYLKSKRKEIKQRQQPYMAVLKGLRQEL